MVTKLPMVIVANYYVPFTLPVPYTFALPLYNLNNMELKKMNWFWRLFEKKIQTNFNVSNQIKYIFKNKDIWENLRQIL